MSEDQNRGSRDFSRYDAMTTEDLEQILRSDASAPMEQETDTELILHVMEVLANRRNANHTGKTARKAWESFQQNYLPPEAESRKQTPKAAKHGTPQPWLRRLIACAAAIILVLCLPLTAGAFGWKDVWNVVAKWAKETFSFVSGDTEVSEPSPDYDGEYTSLQDVMRANSRDYSVIPTWIPDGFALKKIEKDITPAQEIYRAYYTNREKELMIRVQTYTTSYAYRVEIGEDLYETYEASGVQYYIFKNMDQLRFVWTVNNYEGNVSGDISVDEAIKMIESIEKG